MIAALTGLVARLRFTYSGVDGTSDAATLEPLMTTKPSLQQCENPGVSRPTFQMPFHSSYPYLLTNTLLYLYTFAYAIGKHTTTPPEPQGGNP